MSCGLIGMYWAKCKQSNFHKVSQLYIYVCFCLKVIMPWPSLPTGGHSHVIFMGDLGGVLSHLCYINKYIMLIMNDLWFHSYYVIYYEKFRKVMQRTEKVATLYKRLYLLEPLRKLRLPLDGSKCHLFHFLIIHTPKALQHGMIQPITAAMLERFQNLNKTSLPNHSYQSM